MSAPLNIAQVADLMDLSIQNIYGGKASEPTSSYAPGPERFLSRSMLNWLSVTVGTAIYFVSQTPNISLFQTILHLFVFPLLVWRV